MSVTGEPGSDPVKTGIPIADLSAGMFCVIGILSAHAARHATGVGQYIDVSLFESAFALSIWESPPSGSSADSEADDDQLGAIRPAPPWGGLVNYSWWAHTPSVP